MKFGTGVTLFCVLAVIIHILFIVFVFSKRQIDPSCVGDRVDPFSNQDFEYFLIWCIVYFPFLIFCVCYTLLFRMGRSFLCSCWLCCGQNIHGKGAVKCKICFEGVFGNPLIFAIAFIIWGIWEWISFGGSCEMQIQYGFLGDLIIVSLSLLLLCIYYFIRIKRRFHMKRDENIAKKYHNQQREDAQIAAYNEGGKGAPPAQINAQIHNNQYNIQVQAPPNRQQRGQRGRSKFEAEGSGQPLPHVPNRRYSAQPPRQAVHPNGALGPSYAVSAQGIAPYQPQGQRRHSYQPGPVYPASAHGIAPYRPQNNNDVRRHSYQPQPPVQKNNFVQNARVNFNPLIDGAIQKVQTHSKQESASIEISIDFGDDDELIDTGHRTRGPSISFPVQFKGHARQVSSGILDILKKIDAEPECSICMDDLKKGDSMGQLECGHTFHKACIVEWLGHEPSCPMCRVDMKK